MFMPHRPTIDGYEFATTGARLDGVWSLADFSRLRPALLSDAGEIEYSLKGVSDAQDRPALQLTIRGALQLRCQRCLAPLEFPLRVESVLALARSQAEIDALPVEAEGPDWVVAGKGMEVHDLLEDELLLAVPYAPRHEHCRAQGRTGTAVSLSPFAALRGMLDTGETDTHGKRS